MRALIYLGGHLKTTSLQPPYSPHGNRCETRSAATRGEATMRQVFLVTVLCAGVLSACGGIGTHKSSDGTTVIYPNDRNCPPILSDYGSLTFASGVLRNTVGLGRYGGVTASPETSSPRPTGAAAAALASTTAPASGSGFGDGKPAAFMGTAGLGTVSASRT